jgi:hypothetical protein
MRIAGDRAAHVGLGHARLQMMVSALSRATQSSCLFRRPDIREIVDPHISSPTRTVAPAEPVSI